MPTDFEAFAKTALGTDDPERLSAFKEAIMACMSSEESGEYEAPAAGADDMAGGKGPTLKALFGGKK